jgi:telomere length regulation protein
MNMDHSLNRVREVINQLQSPVGDLSTLRSLLSAPLECIGLLPPRFRRYNVNPLEAGACNISRHIPPIQRAVLEHVVPTWETLLSEEGETILLEQYFCPDAFSFTSEAAGELTLLAYSSILSLPLTDYSTRLLARLSKEYPIDRLHFALFSQKNHSARQAISWEDCIRNIMSIPTKVANALGGSGEITAELTHEEYFNNVSVRCEALMYSMVTDAPKSILSSLIIIIMLGSLETTRYLIYHVSLNKARESWCFPSINTYG